MDFEFRDKNLERLYFEGPKGTPSAIDKAFARRMAMIAAAPDEREFWKLKSLHYEKLKGQRGHQKSMRLNDQFRLILEVDETNTGKKMIIVAIEDYH